MLLNLNDPESILQWWQVWPERHDGYLEYKMRASPEFASNIRQAQRLIEARPALSALRARLRSSREAPDLCAPSPLDPQVESQVERPTYKELLAA